METLEKNKMKFKPVLMFDDTERKQKIFESAQNIAKQLNDKLELAENLIGTDLSEKDKLDILKKGNGSFMRLLRKQFQFPNATDEFNLQSMGKENEFEKVKNEVSSIVSLFQAYEFELTKGKVQLTQNGHKTIENEVKLFTSNDSQNKAFEMAQRLSETINSAHDSGYLDVSDLYQIERHIKLVSLPKYSGPKRFRPNHNHVSKIRPDGSMSSLY